MKVTTFVLDENIVFLYASQAKNIQDRLALPVYSKNIFVIIVNKYNWRLHFIHTQQGMRIYGRSNILNP